MTLKRLGNLIQNYHYDETIKCFIQLSDGLADRVFHINHDFTLSDLEKFYLYRTPLHEIPHIWKTKIPPEYHKIGEFEISLLSKIFVSQYPVLSVYGELGCGKTTSKRLIIDILNKLSHCTTQDCSCSRLIADISFAKRNSLNGLENSALYKALYRILCAELSGRVYENTIISEKQEFMEFWNYSHDLKQKSNLDSIAFTEIFENARDYDFSILDDATNEINKRKNKLEEIKKNKELYLDYLIHLWSYIKKNKFRDQSPCAIIFVDNIDQLFPKVQKKIFEILLSMAKDEGPTFIIFMRPETLQQNRKALRPFDFLEHKGVEPIEVFKDRFMKFCENPESFFREEEALPEERKKKILLYARKLKPLFENPHNSYFSFLRNISGRSIRICLIMAQYIFKVSNVEMDKEIPIINELIRASIREGDDQLYWSSDSQCEHLMKVSSGGYASPLIKLRILEVLKKNSNNWNKIHDTIKIIQNFDYPISEIRGAVNDLIKIKRRLVISEEKDCFETDEELKNDTTSMVKINDIGISYCENFASDFQYIQEVMLDTDVEVTYFPDKITYNYFPEKLILQYFFLRFLLAIDGDEVSKFSANLKQTAQYRKYFGSVLLSVGIIQSIGVTVIRLLLNQSVNASQETKNTYKNICDYYIGLIDEAESVNNKIITVQPIPAISDETRTAVENLQK